MASDYELITRHNERQLGLDTSSRKTQICMYSDSTHFIYELLQNADDYGATEVFFKLSRNELLIEHNGEPFKEENVKALTYFGKSTSRDDLVKTGRFGVGFKSVFAFTGSPIIISGDEHFQIYGLYRVREYPYLSNFSRSSTRIILPFNHEAEQPDYVEDLMSSEEAYSKISTRITRLNMNTLLFTRNIREIRWEIEGRVGHHLREDDSGENVRWTTITDGEQLRKYLVFSRIPKWKSQEYKAVEVAFVADEKNQLIPADDFLYVLFATTRETHLQFILNGPYRTNPSREAISEDDHFNVHLIKETCALMKEVLQRVKEMGLLTTQVLAVLPNNTDKLPEFYAPLLEVIIETFYENELVPTDDNQFAVANNVFQGPALLREIITRHELPFFIEREDACWAKGIQNARVDQFLRGLNIQQWGWEQLQAALKKKYGAYSYHANDDNDAWLAERSDSWLQKLYIQLSEAIRKGECSELTLKSCRIIRVLASGEESHIVGSKAYFPKGRSYKDLPQVKPGILRGRTEQATQKIQESLIALGVSEIGDEERIDLILETFYSEDAPKVKTQQHLQHMSTFIKWWKKENDSGKFEDYPIFFSMKEGQLQLHKAEDCYLDAPIHKSGLDLIYRDKNCKLPPKSKLWSGYRKIANEDFCRFIAACGVDDGLRIEKQSCSEHPKSSILRQDYRRYGVKYTITAVNCDYTIKRLPALLRLMNKDVSLLIWRIVSKADPEVLEACFRPNQQYQVRVDKSSLVIALSKAEWIPDKKGHLHRPCDLTKEQLHTDFKFDNRNGWLDAIGFGEAEKRKTEEYKTLKELCKKRGLSEDAVELLDMIASLSKDEQQEQIKELTSHLIKRKKASFPEKESSNPDRRAKKVVESLVAASDKIYEIRERSVRTSNVEIKPMAKTYLKDCYTNSDGEMICQICEEVMPFKLRGGEYYFETVEFMRDFVKECSQRYVALCPICAAKFMNILDTTDEELTKSVTSNEQMTIPILLAGEHATVRFVKVHLEDLKTILNEVQELNKG